MKATNLSDPTSRPAATAQRRTQATGSGGWKHHSMNANPHPLTVHIRSNQPQGDPVYPIYAIAVNSVSQNCYFTR
jgi:hypothetical protein